ncbi:hypothetical protein SUGI_0887750 [Cryptomeria japonica]|nr:hypothetical protein SUGI_0887750 [Cryptomeria japonica]
MKKKWCHNDSHCLRPSNKVLVGIAVGILGIACFILSLVDTFTDSSTGKVHYGIATLNGLATGSKVKPSNESNYKITLKDLFHAALAVCRVCCDGHCAVCVPLC